MDHHTNVRTCTYIKVAGTRCGSPALRGEQFCYFHQRALRQVKSPPNARLHPIALLESEEAIQASLMEVINLLLRHAIDLKRAGLILRALHIAVKNASRVRFEAHSSMVKEVPDYADAPRTPPEYFDLPYPFNQPDPAVPSPEELHRVQAGIRAQYEKDKAAGKIAASPAEGQRGQIPRKPPATVKGTAPKERKHASTSAG